MINPETVPDQSIHITLEDPSKDTDTQVHTIQHHDLPFVSTG